LLGATHLPRMRADVLRDNLHQQEQHWCFLQHPANQLLLQGCSTALVRHIGNSTVHRLAFVGKNTGGGTGWNEYAIASYEATVQQFLRHLLVLIHVSPGPPVRGGEILSATWCNTQRARHIFLKYNRVMLYLQYHKGQQQRERFKDNVRFLPVAVGNLLLDYLIYVVPLRQCFLGEQDANKTVSPFLWAVRQNVWPDARVRECLEQACALAEIPRLTAASWRQIAASIVKAKFGQKLRVLFDVEGGRDEDGDGEGEGEGGDDEDEDRDRDGEDELVVTLHNQSNHGVRTANRAYANELGAGFGNAWDGLVQRSFNASKLWAELLGFDRLHEVERLDGGKHRRQRSEADGQPLLKKIALGQGQGQGQGQGRRRKAWSSAALLQQVCWLYGQEGMK